MEEYSEEGPAASETTINSFQMDIHMDPAASKNDLLQQLDSNIAETFCENGSDLRSDETITSEKSPLDPQSLGLDQSENLPNIVTEHSGQLAHSSIEEELLQMHTDANDPPEESIKAAFENLDDKMDSTEDVSNSASLSDILPSVSTDELRENHLSPAECATEMQTDSNESYNHVSPTELLHATEDNDQDPGDKDVEKQLDENECLDGALDESTDVLPTDDPIISESSAINTNENEESAVEDPVNFSQDSTDGNSDNIESQERDHAEEELVAKQNDQSEGSAVPEPMDTDHIPVSEIGETEAESSSTPVTELSIEEGDANTDKIQAQPADSENISNTDEGQKDQTETSQHSEEQDNRVGAVSTNAMTEPVTPTEALPLTEPLTLTETEASTEAETSTEAVTSIEAITSTETLPLTEATPSITASTDDDYSMNSNLPNSDQSKEKASDAEREATSENTEFVQVNTENDKDDDSSNRSMIELDPIGAESSDAFDSLSNDNREGADEELCIIPDTEREISQAERDAASAIPPLRDLTEANSAALTDSSSEPISTDQAIGSQILIFKYEKEDLQICNECKLVTLNWEEGSLRVKNFTGVSKEPPSLAFIRKCAACKKVTNDIENNLTWEIMDFCNEMCLSKYQKEIGSHCSSCKNEVRANSLGKYCVRFGNDIRQFCTSLCLEKYKKGLKVCSYCQQDISCGPPGFLAPVGDKGQFKDFCSQLCMEKYDIMTNDRPPKVAAGTICSVCKVENPITIEFELDDVPNYFCREPCFVAFSFVNNISPGKCAMCRRHFPKSTLEKHTMYYDNVQHSFCSNSCENIYIIAHRKIVPCSWCKVKKYNFDMIRRYSKEGSVINMCSVNCLSLYKVSIDAVSARQTVCHFCQKLTHPMYHLTMSDATVRNFCSYPCVMSFQSQFPKQQIAVNNIGDAAFPVPTGVPRKNKKHPNPTEASQQTTEPAPIPMISPIHNLSSSNGNLMPPKGLPQSLNTMNTRTTRSKSIGTGPVMNSAPQPQHPVINSYADLPVQVQIKQHFIVRPAPLPEQRNVSTMCYTRKANKATTMKPIMVDEEIQTDEREASKILIPIPIPIYVPTPMHMFSIPTPVPVPIPIPIPIPIFIPTTRNSAAGIMKEIKKIQVKIPTDPYEAEILMMAEMVAEEKKEEITDSESDVDDTGGPEDSYSPEPVDASNTFGDDMLQMALKMATELDEPAVDLEGALTANTITAPQGGEPHPQEENVDDPQPIHHMLDRSPSVRGRKRGMRQSRGGAKRGRRMSHHQVDMPMMQHHQVQQAPPQQEPTEKPDANMCLKYTFGVNAWKQWVTTKNTELEKSSRRVKLFKTEILQLTSDELNYSLCLFVKEVRKPNGAEYAPDTIYYLCLGIQQYLFENGRIDNIFCDPYYEKFTDCLDEVAKKFSVLYNDSHYIVTRVEEEHLWESKQLGAHSPHVLLSTLMFFNTKHFNLTSVDEHMQLSFSHIMKHWKRNPNQPGASKVPGSRNVLLRFYPPQSAIQNNARKKKVYEQQENEENPLRCPVKLYEFYLSKCPESVKTRNDVFYLQPERSCVPDSPVWYSTMPLPKEALEKMLHRVKMVKEINVALLTS